MQSLMPVLRDPRDAVLVAPLLLPQMIASTNPSAAAAAGRALYEGEEGRPGRSDLAYMQHKYTPLDSRIIIITAAILLLLIAILFLNFFIRWALRRLFLSRSQKPIDSNRGLSKRQVQALPSFVYSASKPPPCHNINFYPSLMPFTSHVHTFKPIKAIASIFSHPLYPTTMTSIKVDGIDSHTPSKFEVDKSHHNNTPPQLPLKITSDMVDQVMEGGNPPNKTNENDHDMEGNIPPTKKDKVVSIASVPTPHDHMIHGEVKGTSPTFQGGNPINGCTKSGEMANHYDDNASSLALCPICLIEFADGDIIRVLPTCRHYFHIGCIDLWLVKSSSCPACRANLLEATRNPIIQPTLQVQVVTTISHH